MLYDANDGLYHMYASEISNHCGIHRWLSDSIVVHATSQGAKDGWKFERQEAIDVLPKFSHEPVAVRDPASGATVLFVRYVDVAMDHHGQGEKAVEMSVGLVGMLPSIPTLHTPCQR